MLHSGSEEHRLNIGRVAVVHVIEHVAQIARFVDRRNLAAFPQPKMRRALPATEIRRGIARAPAKSALYNVLKLPVIIRRIRLLRHLKMRFENVVHILQKHGRALLNILRRKNRARLAAVGLLQHGRREHL